MNFNEYQRKTRLTDKGVGQRHGLEPPWLYYALGIAGETGELVEKVKKHFRDYYGCMNDQQKKAIIKEMGDILWYIARLADSWQIKFDDVAKENIEKLLSRKERGTIHGEGDDR